MKKKLLILGSTSFIGKSIIDFLQQSKKYDKLFSHIYLLSKSNKNKVTGKFKSRFKISYIYGDLSNLEQLPLVDYIIYASLSEKVSKDLVMMNNFVNLAKSFHKRTKIIYLSSGAVNGNQPENKKSIKENDYFDYKKFGNSYKKKYAIAKLKNENRLRTLIKKNNSITIIIARCFTFVGEHLPLHGKFIIGNIIRKVIQNKPIDINLNKKVIRSFMHSSDLAKVILILLIKEKKQFEIYNIGSDNKSEISKLIPEISKKYNLKYSIKFKNKIVKKDIYIPNISKFRKKYSYYKELKSFDAIVKTINNLRRKYPENTQKY